MPSPQDRHPRWCRSDRRAKRRHPRGARSPRHPVHRRRRHRARHLARQRARVRRRGREGLRRQEEDRLDRGLRRREGQDSCSTTGCPTRRSRRSRLPRRHQGPADDAGRRRHPLAQRRAAPDARPLRLPAAGALVQGRAAPGEGAREGRHGDLPREHRGHLRRHRVGGRVARGEEGHRVPAERDGREEDPLPGDVGHRHQAGVARGHRAARSAPRSSTRSRTSARASPWCTRATS